MNFSFHIDKFSRVTWNNDVLNKFAVSLLVSTREKYLKQQAFKIFLAWYARHVTVCSLASFITYICMQLFFASEKLSGYLEAPAQGFLH